MTQGPSVARRGFLMGLTAVAVVGFDPVNRSWVTDAQAHHGFSRVPRLDGELLTDPASLAAAADDFGHYIHRTPRAVLKPASTSDVVKMVRYAKDHRIDIAMRGQGHSTHGQSQVEAGIVIDSSTLNRIYDVSAGDAVVGAGARWREIIEATLPRGLTPPVLPNFIDITIGGNIAGGGIGGASHRHGAVVDNVLELEVVTGEGELRRCSQSQNAALFNAVLGGLGQFAIVVKARIRLIPAKPMARQYTVQYPDVGSYMDDARTLAMNERFDHVEAQVNGAADGTYQTVTMFAVKHFHPSSPPNDAAMLSGLDHAGVTIQDMPYETFLKRLDPIIDFVKSIGLWLFPHPWFDVFMPESKAEEFVLSTLSEITVADTLNGSVLLYPLRRSKFRRPLLRVPDGEEVFYLYDVLPFAPPDPAAVDAWIARNTGWYDRASDLGGKRYNIGSVNWTPEDWRRHFSPLWAAVLLAKRAYDPRNILTPGQGIFRDSDCD